MISSPAAAAINHLLDSEPWARAKLARHAGKVAVIDTGMLALRLAATADGMVQAAPEDAAAAVTIHVALADVPLILSDRKHAFSYVRIEGDADFANTISQLSESLRWEAEHDLARWIGDVPAMRVTAAARGAVEGARDTRRRLEENLAEYFLEENPMLVRRKAVSDFASEVAQLRDDVERLSKRIDKLGRR
ncbi:MAG TPA: SCP2 sterol-binding domain-containing protein [Noviherbaspirillum sp.]